MDHILKALNDALENKEYQIKWLNEEIEKLRRERDDLKAENDKVRAYVEQLENTISAEEEEEEDF